MNIFETLIVQPIFNLLFGIYSLIPGGDFGIALILFTIIIRFLMWPLVTGQLHQAKAMRKLQPELKKIRKSAKGNRQLESMQMLELYKKHDIKPFRSILILLIQLPIFIALYQVIQIFTLQREKIETFTYGFMQGIQPVKDLIANPDQFNETLFGVFDLTTTAINAHGIDIFLVILALIAAGTQYIISKQVSPTGETKRFRDVMAEAGNGKQPDQSELNAVMMSKMTKILPFVMLVIMLNLPGALALYYATSNIFAAIQQHFLLSKDKEELEEIASEPDIKPTGKKATAKARARVAKEANITRITAKDTPKKNKETS